MLRAPHLALLAALLPVLAQAGQAADSDLPVHATLLGQRYVLENQQQRCALRKNDQSLLVLDIPWPCHFSIGEHGQAHVEIFRQVPIVIALHSEALAQNPQQCQSQYQAIRLFKGQLEHSIVYRHASCLRGKGDQKAYVGVFDW